MPGSTYLPRLGRMAALEVSMGGYVEFDKRLNWIGIGVFLVLFAVGLLAYAFAVSVGAEFTLTGFLLVLGISAAGGLLVHAVWQIVLTPVAWYLHWVAMGRPKASVRDWLRAALVVTVGLGLAYLVIAAAYALVDLAQFPRMVVHLLLLALAVVGAVRWQRWRRRIPTIDLAKSRDITLK